jgi:hypothetical protein
MQQHSYFLAGGDFVKKEIMLWVFLMALLMVFFYSECYTYAVGTN